MKPSGLRPLLLAVAAAASVLAGCGPGVGGTGTGKGYAFIAVYRATSTPLCGAGFAASLACTVVGTTQPGDPAMGLYEQGTRAVTFVDDPAIPATTMRVEANSVELDVPCRTLHFSGDWGITASGDARFFGVYTDPTLRDGAAASLQVQDLGSPGQPVLGVTLRDVAGRVLYGPVRLQRSTAAAATPAC